MTYGLALLSDIPLVMREGTYWTLDLWAQDLQAQAASVGAVTLVCPVVDDVQKGTVLLPLPAAIQVVDLAAGTAAFARAVDAVDVVQVPGNFTWRRSRHARAFMRLARRAGKPVVLGISSDRATTLLVNARGQNLPRRIRARLGSLSIKISQRYLAARCDGAFVVGEGLRRIVEPASSNVFVGTASWIRSSDILPTANVRRDPSTIRLCVAARLEQMKGIGLALDAMALLRARDECGPIALLIAGQGPEEAALRTRCASLQLDDVVTFAGTFAYPGPFFELLRAQDIVVLTNLNDEQPRLVFDAVSQGCLIVCPDTVPYRALGIPQSLLFRRGDPADLAQAIARAIALIDDMALRTTLESLARAATIETMHERRRDWVQSTLLSKPRDRRTPASPSAR